VVLNVSVIRTIAITNQITGVKERKPFKKSLNEILMHLKRKSVLIRINILKAAIAKILNVRRNTVSAMSEECHVLKGNANVKTVEMVSSHAKLIKTKMKKNRMKLQRKSKQLQLYRQQQWQ